MLQLSGSIIGRPVLSLRTGGPIAIVTGPIINPNNLKIEGWYCQDRMSRRQLILLSQDIREVAATGLAVNDHDVLTDETELVRLKEVLSIAFQLIGKLVVTESKQRLGKINDYAVEVETMYIQKLYVGQSLLKSLSGGNLVVDRSQVIEVTDRKIIVQDLIQPVRRAVPAPSQAPAT